MIVYLAQEPSYQIDFEGNIASACVYNGILYVLE